MSSSDYDVKIVAMNAKRASNNLEIEAAQAELDKKIELYDATIQLRSKYNSHCETFEGYASRRKNRLNRNEGSLGIAAGLKCATQMLRRMIDQATGAALKSATNAIVQGEQDISRLLEETKRAIEELERKIASLQAANASLDRDIRSARNAKAAEAEKEAREKAKSEG